MIANEVIEFIKNNISIIDLAENIYALNKKKEKSTKTYPVYIKGDEKFIVNAQKNIFFTDNNRKGDVIEFVKTIENLSFREAVEKIISYYNLNFNIEQEQTITNVNNINKNKNFERNEKLKQEIAQVEKEREAKKEKWIKMYNLITNTQFSKEIRGISKELLNFLLEKKQIKHYVNKEKGWDIIKVELKDENKKTIGGQDIFFNNETKKWQKIINGHAGISTLGNEKKADFLVISESFFDAISAYEMALLKAGTNDKQKAIEQAFDKICTISTQGALNDLKKRAILNLLRENKNLKAVVFALDSDEAGEKMKNELKEFLEQNGVTTEAGYNIVDVIYENNIKDLNELLQNQKKKLMQQQKGKEKEQEQEIEF